LRIVGGITYVGTLVVTSFIVSRLVDVARQALRVAEQRGQELDEASRRAERAAQTEREAREREARTAWQLREAVRRYVAFLERVSAGDYGTRLDIDQVAQGEGSGELRALGHYLNSTVETLVEALQDMQVIQRRYLAQAWESALQADNVRRGFRCRDQRVEPSDGAWLPSMTRAVRNRGVTVSDGGLALPITVGGQVIGALGALREGEARWSDEDVALVRSAVDQLAQTMESLRLLDETQRREAREQTIGRAIARMRESLELDDVLKTAVGEIQRALNLDELVVRLTTAQPARGDGGDGGNGRWTL
jgi:GAF domain-containing protein